MARVAIKDPLDSTRIATYDPSAHTPDHTSDPDAIINPDLTTLNGESQKPEDFHHRYWDVDGGDNITLALAAERLLRDGSEFVSGRARIFLFDDFVDQIPGNWKKKIRGVTSKVDLLLDTPGGFVSLKSGAVANEFAEQFSRSSDYTIAKKADVEFVIQEVTNGDAVLSFGFFADSDNSLLWKRDGSGNWLGVSRGAGTENTVTPSPAIPGDTSVHTIRIQTQSGQATFLFDGISRGSVTTNLPSVSMRVLKRIESKSGVGSVRDVKIDSVRVEMDR